MGWLDRLLGERDDEALPLYAGGGRARARRRTGISTGAVPDTIDGRFDMIAAVLATVLLRLETRPGGRGAGGAADRALRRRHGRAAARDRDRRHRRRQACRPDDGDAGRTAGRVSRRAGRRTIWRPALVRNLYRGDAAAPTRRWRMSRTRWAALRASGSPRYRSTPAARRASCRDAPSRVQPARAGRPDRRDERARCGSRRTRRERAALARRFDLIGIDRLEADSRSARRGGRAWSRRARVRARGDAALRRHRRAAARRDRRAGGASLRRRRVGRRGGGRAGRRRARHACRSRAALIDLGEAAAETLALALDPFPRSPDADAMLAEAGVIGEDEAQKRWRSAIPFAAWPT